MKTGDFFESILAELNELMGLAGISKQKELAKMLSTTQETVSRWFRRENRPCTYHMREINWRLRKYREKEEK